MAFNLLAGHCIGYCTALLLGATGLEKLGLVALGLVAALMPGADFVAHTLVRLDLIRRSQARTLFHPLTDLHRNALHKPPLLIPIALAVGSVHSWSASVMCAICVVVHLLYDSAFHGAGIAWLWPLPLRRPYFLLAYVKGRLHLLRLSPAEQVHYLRQHCLDWQQQADQRQGYYFAALYIWLISVSTYEHVLMYQA